LWKKSGLTNLSDVPASAEDPETVVVVELELEPEVVELVEDELLPLPLLPTVEAVPFPAVRVQEEGVFGDR